MAYEQNQELWGQAQGSGSDRVYVSRVGDSLQSVAAFFYGDPVHAARITQENPAWAAYKTDANLPGGSILRMPED